MFDICQTPYPIENPFSTCETMAVLNKKDKYMQFSEKWAVTV